MGKRNFEKQKIYYSRTYRHLQVDKKKSLLFLFLFVLPCVIGLFLFYGELTAFVTNITGWVLNRFVPSLEVSYRWTDFIPFLDDIKIAVIPTVYPSIKLILINLGVLLAAVAFCILGKMRNHSAAIYVMIILFIHMINCVFFLFAGKEFPYTSIEYSELYMKQQVGIWICFLVIMGLVTGILGDGSILLRIGAVAGVMAYSLCFGLFRYIVFLFIMYKFSMLYMAAFFFVLGPFFDFMYLVMIYGLYVDKLTGMYTTGKRKEKWLWS